LGEERKSRLRGWTSVFDSISDIGQNLTLHWVLTAYLPDGVLKIVARREREDKAA
jgi:hypothetical protein